MTLPQKSLIIYLLRLWQMILKLEKYCENCKTYEDFITSNLRVDACVVPLIQIGEIAGAISKYYSTNISDIPLKKIINFRNILVHVYNQIDTKVLRDTIQNAIPKLKKTVQNYFIENNVDTTDENIVYQETY